MVNTPNGWPVLPTLDGVRKVVIPGTARHLFIADGASAMILGHYALWYHEELERLDLGPWDEWGWAVRPQRGTTATPSEHGAARAIDLNATRHPMGTEPLETLTRFQVARIRGRLDKRYRSLVRWGGEWSRPDPMHYDLVGNELALGKLARVLSRTPRGKRLAAANPGLLGEL